MKFLKKPKYIKFSWNWVKVKISLKRVAFWTWRAVTYPFKQWWVWLLMLIILFLAPTFNGVRPAIVHQWYWNKIKSVSTDVYNRVSSGAKNIVSKADISFDFESPFAVEGVDKLVATSESEKQVSSRKTFAKSNEMPKGVDVKNTPNQNLEGIVPVLENNTMQMSLADVIAAQLAQLKAPVFSDEEKALLEKDDNDYRRDVGSLVYVAEPQFVEGAAMVYNANAIDVGGVYVILFGIYANPETEKGKIADALLSRIIENHTVNCKIVAYTKEGVPTGICYLGNINLNKLLVLQSLSQNVAL